MDFARVGSGAVTTFRVASSSASTERTFGSPCACVSVQANTVSAIAYEARKAVCASPKGPKVARNDANVAGLHGSDELTIARIEERS
jgi:hypothetical protein